MAEPNWFTEDGVTYRRDTKRVPLGAGETLLYYTWEHLPSGKTGKQVIVLPVSTFRRAEEALFRLLMRWNGLGASTWRYDYSPS